MSRVWVWARSTARCASKSGDEGAVGAWMLASFSLLCCAVVVVAVAVVVCVRWVGGWVGLLVARGWIPDLLHVVWCCFSFFSFFFFLFSFFLFCVVRAVARQVGAVGDGPR